MRGGNEGDIEANHNFRIRRSLLRFLRKYSTLIEFQSRFAVCTNGIVFPQKWGELVCKTMQPLEPAGVFSNRFYGRSWTNCRRRSNIVFLVENTFFTWTESNRTYSMFFCLTFHADRPKGSAQQIHPDGFMVDVVPSSLGKTLVKFVFPLKSVSCSKYSTLVNF